MLLKPLLEGVVEGRHAHEVEHVAQDRPASRNSWELGLLEETGQPQQSDEADRHKGHHSADGRWLHRWRVGVCSGVHSAPSVSRQRQRGERSLPVCGWTARHRRTSVARHGSRGGSRARKFESGRDAWRPEDVLCLIGVAVHWRVKRGVDLGSDAIVVAFASPRKVLPGRARKRGVERERKRERERESERQGGMELWRSL
eukprot:scaffold1467_cov264-Pinguiococcus_pyrenoidosus.AAC.17